MTKFKARPLLSLLLALVMVVTMLPMTALVMVVTMLPMTALAAEVPEETTTVCPDEHCTHDHAEEISASADTSAPTSIEESPVVEEMTAAETPEATTPVDTPNITEETPETPEVDELPTVETPALENVETPEAPAETNTYSGYIGDSAVEWELDPASGRLFITGSGGCDAFTSSDDQPWADLRTEIREVWFNSMDTLAIENLSYWFDGCISLKTAEAPYTTPVIGSRAFANCPSLTLLMLYHNGADFEIADGAFYTDSLTVLEVACIVENASVIDTLSNHDWSASNRAAFFLDVYGTTYMATGYCASCKKTCSYTVEYEQWSSTEHCVRHWCSNCGFDQCGGVNGQAHTFSNGVCTKCGYNNGSGGGGGGGSVCYHNSTYKSWSGCNWTEYCSNCGAYISSGTSHGSTYTSWNGCNWYEYCRDCGQLMDSGTSHSYSYGGWEYYNSSRHRRTGTCTSCGATTYSYGYHSTSTQYSQYSSTQHSYGSYCSTCASYVGSVSYASHNFRYGSWQNYSGTQHRRLKTCATCGYSEYEYSSHSLSYGSWTNYSASQHRRTVSCSTCEYNSYEYASHSLTYGAWASISDTQHRRTLSCSCGYGTTESGAHTDTDDNGYCDDCEYLMTRFSVTVPVSLSLTVSEHGAVYAADNAAIVNNSTGAVAVTGVTVSAANGWTLVPFSSNMAAAKVDSKQIGFALNGAQSRNSGTLESLSLPGAWQIAKGASLPLSYNAVVSALSQPVSEQVLTVVFVLDWAA